MVVAQTSWIECNTQQAVALSDHSNKNPPKALSTQKQLREAGQ